DDLQVAQAAGRLLEVRLERVRRVLVLGVALFLLELLRLEERDRIHRAGERLLHAPVERAAAGQEARFQQRGAHRDVVARRRDATLYRAHAVADLQADVPERADQAL